MKAADLDASHSRIICDCINIFGHRAASLRRRENFSVLRRTLCVFVLAQGDQERPSERGRPTRCASGAPRSSQEPTMTGPRHPEVCVPLVGQDGNIFSIIGRVIQALKRAGVEQAERDKFWREVSASKSYDAALAVVMRWVEVE
jgi:hypothetical protein